MIVVGLGDSLLGSSFVQVVLVFGIFELIFDGLEVAATSLVLCFADVLWDSCRFVINHQGLPDN
jgi:hypothetical protein